MRQILFAMMTAILVVLSCGNRESANATVAAPSALAVEVVGDASAKLSWNHDGTGVEGWWVFIRKEDDSFHVKPVNMDSPLPADARSYVFEGLEEGKSYYFGVQALAGQVSANSQAVYAERFTMPVPEPASEDPGPEPSGDTEQSADPEAIPVAFKADISAMTAEFKSTSTSGEDLLITLAPVSANKTVQIDVYAIGNESFQSYTDWIGPFNMKTVAATAQTEKAWGFTGGWHGSNGDGTGDPTARTIKIEASLDGNETTSGTGSEATVKVFNQVEAANTKFNETKRFVLDETVTYTFKEGRLYVRVDITAREDVKILIYYGMQIAGGFCKSFTFTTEDGKEESTTGTLLMKGKVRDMTGFSTGGHSVTAHMFDEGLGTYSLATPAYSALTQYYGENNGKGYYMLIGDKDASSKSYTMKMGETVYWSGYYEFK